MQLRMPCYILVLNKSNPLKAHFIYGKKHLKLQVQLKWSRDPNIHFQQTDTKICKEILG